MRTVIIEDEPLASERLRLLLNQYDPKTAVAASLESIDEAVKWFSNNTAPDLILSDIQLSDGPAFEIFQQVKIASPVIFTTAFDKYALEAFKLLSIDYLLKPVTFEALANALDKLKILQSNPSKPLINYDDVIKLLQRNMRTYKTRFTGKIGVKIFFVETRNIAFFSSDNKIVYLVTLDNSRYITDHTLENLEELLDPCLFYRVNRSMIINIAAINQVKPYENNRLLILLKKNIRPEEVIVSRDRVPHFRKWTDD